MATLKTEGSSRRRSQAGPVAPARWWRTARAALAFAYYGAGSLALAFGVFPIQRLLGRLTGSGRPADLRAQRAIHLGSRSFVALMEGLRLIRFSVRGRDALHRGPVLVVANHPSLIDTPLITTCMPQADFIVSPDWGRNVFFRRAVVAAGYLRASDGAGVIADAVARLRAGRSVVVYPEGSRTPPEGLRRFQRGAAHIALEAGCDLLPVLIRVAPRMLMRGERWTYVPPSIPVWELEVGEPIRPADHLDGTESRSVAARRLTAVLQDHFEKGWERGII